MMIKKGIILKSTFSSGLATALIVLSIKACAPEARAGAEPLARIKAKWAHNPHTCFKECIAKRLVGEQWRCERALAPSADAKGISSTSVYEFCVSEIENGENWQADWTRLYE